MRALRNGLYFFAGVLLAFIFLIPSAFAQVPVSSTYSGITPIINRIVQSTPGISTVAISSGGVSVSSAGAVNVATSTGLRIAVPTTATAAVSEAAIAAGAAKIALRIIPAVATAMTIAQVASMISDSGIKPCAPPDFFCKPAAADQVLPTVNGGWKDAGNGYPGPYPSADALCTAYSAAWNASHPTNGSYILTTFSTKMLTASTAQCIETDKYVATGNLYRDPFPVAYPQSFNDLSCPTGYVLSGSICIAVNPHMIPATEKDVSDATVTVLSKRHDLGKVVYDDLVAVAQANPSAPPLVKTDDAPLTITASPVSSPQTTISTRTLTNPDGTTSTETTKQTVTVTPTTGPSGTVGNPTNTFPTSSVTTITTTNNTTNVTTTTTTTNNLPAPASTDPAPALNLPTDYNREATQQKLLDELSGANAPAQPEDQASKTKTATDKVDSDLDSKFKSFPTDFDKDKLNWFSWVWTPPVGVCNDADYKTTVHGFEVSFSICEWVGKIRDVIGWLFALFGAMDIYGRIFRQGGE